MPRVPTLAAFLLAAAACGERADSVRDESARVSDEPAASGARAPAGLVAPALLAAALPDRLGPFEAFEQAEHAIEHPGGATITRALRRYRDGERTATLRAIDAAHAPALVMGFAAAQRLEMAAFEVQEIVPTGIAGRPALAAWDPRTATSEAQVLAGRIVIALAITPAREPEEAVEVLEHAPIAAIEALPR